MGLISTIRSVLGLGDSGDRSRDGATGTNVIVERETDATSERAVKESDAAAVTVEGESEPTDEEDTADGTSVEEIRGIGPAYAERLADAGVHTVSELAAADAAELGSETEIGENRVANWIERANEY